MKKRFLAIFIVVLMLFSQVAVFASDISLEDNSTSKITEELAEAMEQATDDEYIPIYIWLESYDDSMVYALLSKNLGIIISKDTEESYIQAVTNEKIELLNTIQAELGQTSTMTLNASNNGLSTSAKADIMISQAKIPSVMSKKEIETCIESEMSTEEIINLSERTQFISDWRDTRKSLNELVNNAFYNKLNQNECRNIYVSPMITYIELDCTKSYIYDLNQVAEIEEIGSNVKLCSYDTENVASEEEIMPLDSTDGYGYHMVEREGISYDAAGIKIGVLEVPEKHYDVSKNELPEKGVKYDENNIHLSGADITYKYDYSGVSEENRAISKHATTVLSIICGQPVLYGNNGSIYYKGLAPNAKVYYANATRSNYENSLKWLINDCKVSIINMSFAMWDEDNNGNTIFKYNNIDVITDKYVRDYRVVIVAAAGNINNETNEYGKKINPNGMVTPPGLAYNVITVGNAEYLCNTNDEYILNGSSCYNQHKLIVNENEIEYLTNKPDICAFGTDIFILNEDHTTEWRGSGTSFAAPMVTGTVALMLKANSSLIYHPDKVKAILLASADEEAIDTTDNPIRNSSRIITDKIYAFGATRYKSGAGLLNIPASVTNANSAYSWSYSFSNYSASTSLGSQKLFIPSDTVFKIGCVFEKATDEILESRYDIDVNIRIKDMSGVIIMDSKDSLTNHSVIDNVELFNVVFNTSGEYLFELYFNADTTDFDSPAPTVNTTMVVACTCTNPDISGYSVSNVAYRKTCYNCYCFDVIESYNETTYNENFSAGTMHYNMQYTNIYLDNVKVIDRSYFSVSCSLSNSSYASRITLSDKNTTYTSNGYIEQRSYIVAVLNSNGDSVATYTVNVTIECDSVSGEFYLRN